jgi:hypothetical protein
MAGPRAGAMAAGCALTVAVLRSLAGLRSRWDGQRNDYSEHGKDTLHLLLLLPLAKQRTRSTGTVHSIGPRVPDLVQLFELSIEVTIHFTTAAMARSAW